ncbi:MAG TPA: glutamine synthetase adenylyltransferase [Thermoanaerobaculia bacterium]|nr:glutamine synthetase adenylyltransferase [Thermoanaerobaculia bacterium]
MDEARATAATAPPHAPLDDEALGEAGFGDPSAARRRLAALEDNPGGARLRAEIERVLRGEPGLVADPDGALVALERLLHDATDPQTLLQRELGGPRRVHNVLAVLGASGYLTEVVLRHPAWLGELSGLHQAARRRDEGELRRELEAEAGLEQPWHTAEPRPLSSNVPPAMGRDAVERALDGLRRVHQHELLRIGGCDLLALFDLETILDQVSLLADEMVRAALEAAWRSLPDRPDPRRFCVLALGKLGARELNYSSDIDLVFLAEDEAPLYWALAKRLSDYLSRPTGEGFLHRVDLRLRPWGRDGPLVSTRGSYLEYLSHHASAAELQSLLKARPIAGALAIGERFLDEARTFVFRERDPDVLRADVLQLKERIEGELRARGESWGQVKSGEGSIRDVEFTTQYLQLLHCPVHEDLGLRAPATLDALDALREHGLLADADHRVLVQGYVFLRTVEHDLQLVGNLQAHQLPRDPLRLRHLARRLGFHDEGGAASATDATARFLGRYQEHARAVRAVYLRHMAPTGSPRPAEAAYEPPVMRMPAPYLAAFSTADVERHRHTIAALEDSGRRVAVSVQALEEHRYGIEILGRDALGTLSLVCGLLHAYRCNIVEGQVFTSEEVVDAHAARLEAGARTWGRGKRWLVDVFIVEPKDDGPSLAGLAADLGSLLDLLHDQGHTQAQLALAKRVSLALPDGDGSTDALPVLYPLDIEVDNGRSERHTVLFIEGTDTPGFLYELTNALALSEISVEMMEVSTAGSRVRDTLWVTDRDGRKILEPAALRRLKLTTVLIKHFTHLLPRAPDPERALLHFHQLLDDLFARESWEHEIATLEQPTVLASLAQLLGQSDFLWRDFLRMQHENLFPVVQDIAGLEEARPRHELEQALDEALASRPPEERAEALAAFQDREMFRVDMRKILRRGAAFDQFSRELTELAEILCTRVVELSYRDLVQSLGDPVGEDGEVVPFTLFALGKFGGRELGFGSDLELMLIYEREGRTASQDKSASELFRTLVAELRGTLGDRRTLALDLRLRPYGQTGSLAVTRESFETYFAPEGDAWPYERQALVKMRALTGDAAFGEAIEQLRDRLVYELGHPDPAACRALRERQIRHLVVPGTINAKFTAGALVDVEYLVQLLQMHHGRRRAQLRSTNTLAAIGELHAAGALDAHDYDLLVDAYRFYRLLIDALRMVRGHAKDLTVPAADSEEYAFLARRLAVDSPDELRRRLERHLDQVPKLQSRLLANLEARLQQPRR